MLGPSTIELYPLFLGERECSLTLCVGKAFPKSDCKFGSIAGRKLQQLGKRVWFHAVILSREVSCRNWIGALRHRRHDRARLDDIKICRRRAIVD